MTRILQGRSTLASELLRQIQTEHDADLLLLSEQYLHAKVREWPTSGSGAGGNLLQLLLHP